MRTVSTSSSKVAAVTGHGVGTPQLAPRADPTLWAVVATYMRPSVLRDTLEQLSLQSRPPDRVFVIDNGAQPAVAAAASAFGATYVAAPENLGPAGALTHGAALVLERAGDSDWVLFVDDDDPPSHTDDLERLTHLAQVSVITDHRIAGVGFEGSCYRRSSGTFRRVADHDLHGVIDVDTLFGGSLPMYRVPALREVGGPDPAFFWGFEEAELGLHLRSLGYRLVTDGDRWRERRASRESSTGTKPGSTPLSKSAWRRYYSVRNSTVIAKRHARWWAVPYVALGGAAKGTAAMVRTRRAPSETILPIRGALDGLLGRLGRRVDPGLNVKSRPNTPS